MQGLKLLLLLMAITTVSAQTWGNESMTDSYKQFNNDQQFQAVLTVYTSVLGEFFYLALAFTGYLGIYLYNKSSNIAAIWLSAWLVAWGTLIGNTYANAAFALLIGLWIWEVYRKAFSPVYTH